MIAAGEVPERPADGGRRSEEAGRRNTGGRGGVDLIRRTAVRIDAGHIADEISRQRVGRLPLQAPANAHLRLAVDIIAVIKVRLIPVPVGIPGRYAARESV